MLKILQNKQLIHIAVEVLILSIITVMFSRTTNSLNKKIADLQEIVNLQRNTIAYHDVVINQLKTAVTELSQRSNLVTGRHVSMPVETVSMPVETVSMPVETVSMPVVHQPDQISKSRNIEPLSDINQSEKHQRKFTVKNVDTVPISGPSISFGNPEAIEMGDGYSSMDDDDIEAAIVKELKELYDSDNKQKDL
jgi:hypothetical protein